MELLAFKFFLFIGYFLTAIEGELRCHCNESGCVSTGYMCKSQADRCFTSIEVTEDGTTRRTYGCIESLPEDHRDQCQLTEPEPTPTKKTQVSAAAPVVVVEVTGDTTTTPGKISPEAQSEVEVVDAVAKLVDGENNVSSTKSSRNVAGNTEKGEMVISGSSSSESAPPEAHSHNYLHHRQQLQQHLIKQQVDQLKRRVPVLLCCTSHMCNYREDADDNTKTRLNSTFPRGGSIPSTVHVRGDHHLMRRRNNSDSDRDLWFKAAVIAVPIAGGFILILLVLLAVRMLRSDSNRHRRLIKIRRERSLTKAQLYVSDHFVGGGGGRGLFPDTSTQGKADKHCSSLFQEKFSWPRKKRLSGGSNKFTAKSGPSSRSSLSGSRDAFRDFNNSFQHNVGSYSTSINGKDVSVSLPCCSSEGVSCCGGVCVYQRDSELGNHCDICRSSKRLSQCSTCGGTKICRLCPAEHFQESIHDMKPFSENPFSETVCVDGEMNNSATSSTGMVDTVTTSSANTRTNSPFSDSSIHNSINSHQAPRSFSPNSGSLISGNSAVPSGNICYFHLCSHHGNTYPHHHNHHHHQLHHPQQCHQCVSRFHHKPHQHHHQHHPEPHRTVVATWDKTNPLAPTAAV